MRAFRRLALFLLAALGAAAVSGVAAPSAGKLSRVPPGVSVAGLPVGGFTSEEARALVRDSLSAPVQFELGERRWSASAEALGVAAAVDRAIAGAVRGTPGTDVDVEAAASPPALSRYLARLDRRLSRPARDAAFVGLDRRLRPILSRHVDGRRLDREATGAAIRTSVQSAVREPVRPVFRTVRAKITRRDVGPIVVIRRESKGLYLYEHGKLVRRVGVATGQARYPTPVGTFSIVDMQYNPWWYPPDSEWAKGLKPVPPGPGNPLGTRWMGLSAWGVGMHGTPDAASIGYSASHGCIRMRIPDAEWLFTRVHLGTPVVIVSA